VGGSGRYSAGSYRCSFSVGWASESDSPPDIVGAEVFGRDMGFGCTGGFELGGFELAVVSFWKGIFGRNGVFGVLGFASEVLLVRRIGGFEASTLVMLSDVPREGRCVAIRAPSTPLGPK